MKSRNVLVILLVGFLMSIAAGSAFAAALASGQVRATELVYRKFPHGRASYLSRLLVTRGFLRFDDGRADDSFLLFDRHARTIYSVDKGDRTILVIAPHPINVTPPIPLRVYERHKPETGAPSIDGRTPVHYSFYANDHRCEDVMVVPGLLGNVRKALMDFRRTLAGQQAADMDKTPLSMQSACSLADLIFYPDRTLDHGFPILEWKPDGDRKELLDYHHAVWVSDTLFRLPQGYRYYKIGPNGMVTIHPAFTPR